MPPAPDTNLRSARWFARSDEIGARHRSVLRLLGHDPEEARGRPVIGVCNPRSDLNNCELGFDAIAEAVRRGVTAAGGVPMTFGAMPLGAELCKPSDLLYRNLVAMEVEETLRAYPLDGVVLLANCDKTTPAQLMAAASADLPALQFSGGPRTPGSWRGQVVSSGTDIWRHWDDLRRGRIDDAQWQQLESCIACTHGACNEMGTNSTMTGISEALGMMPPGTSTIPASDPSRLVAAEAAGARIVSMVTENVRPARILTAAAFENAIRFCMAVGGSTNAIIHLIAIAGRRCIDLPMSLFDDISRQTPVIANLKPSGEHLLADLHEAGGVPAVLNRIAGALCRDCLSVSGSTLGQIAADGAPSNDDVILPVERALASGGGLRCLGGNLAPRGAVLKASATSSALLQHTGPALVFEDYDAMLERLDDADLDVTPQTVIVLRRAGPRGVPGMPEWGSIPIPTRLLRQGVTDMVRISDARMSGTSYGTVVLHIAPEAVAGGPLAVVRDGDPIRLDADRRRLDLMIDDEELRRRMAQWSAPPPSHRRGYPRLFAEHVLQADEGCDFDFLKPRAPDDLRFVEPIIGRS